MVVLRAAWTVRVWVQSLDMDEETSVVAEVKWEMDDSGGLMSRPLLVCAEAEESVVTEVAAVMVEEELMTAVVVWFEVVVGDEKFVE